MSHYLLLSLVFVTKSDSSRLLMSSWAPPPSCGQFDPRVNEGFEVVIDCSPSQIIITEATYGGTDSGTTADCDQSLNNVLSIVQGECDAQGGQTCSFVANNGLFGDPCPGIPKGFSYCYTCGPPPPPPCDCECKNPPSWNSNPCAGAPDGNYINCADPNSFVMCSNGNGYKQPCPGVHWGQPQLVFDPCAGTDGECSAPGESFECEGPPTPVPGPCECRSNCAGVGADWQNFKPCPGTDGCAPTGYIACGVWGQTTHFMPCPAGLEFDPTKGDPQSGQCVYPHEVECHCGSECDP